MRYGTTRRTSIAPSVYAQQIEDPHGEAHYRSQLGAPLGCCGGIDGRARVAEQHRPYVGGRGDQGGRSCHDRPALGEVGGQIAFDARLRADASILSPAFQGALTCIQGGE